MFAFLSKNQENNRLELLIDGGIFSEAVVMKAAYMFLDRCYFFFKRDGENTLVQIHPKENQRWSSEAFALEYSDELLATLLRDKLERDNKTIRETIVMRALGSYVDSQNFVPNQISNSNPQIDFDRDIDEILKEIENDPELKIDQGEIDRILKEIEVDMSGTQTKKTPQLDPNKVKNAKEKFQSR
ncbi:MAG: hypothetical protein HHAS10_09840 [Candidatus Altimarinota bacterium]